MQTVRSFEDLDCWQKASEIRRMISELTRRIPPRDFDMIDNMKRAARSCTRNIAEGYGRFHYQENIQFCRISRGSMTELKDDLISCLDEKYITDEEFKNYTDLIDTGIRILNGYIRYLTSAKSNNQ